MPAQKAKSLPRLVDPVVDRCLVNDDQLPICKVSSVNPCARVVLSNCLSLVRWRALQISLIPCTVLVSLKVSLHC